MESWAAELPRLRRRPGERTNLGGGDFRLPEVIIYDHVCFKGAYARTNLSFHYLGDFWNDRISSLIVVSGVWRFYRDEYYKGDHWDLGPGFYECFFTDGRPGRRREFVPGDRADLTNANADLKRIAASIGGLRQSTRIDSSDRLENASAAQRAERLALV